MKLLQEIVDLLSADIPNLENALFKSQVLAHRLGEKEMAAWVGAELKGYGDPASVPDYRKLPIIVMAALNNGVYRYAEQSVPMMRVDKWLRDKLETRRITESVIVVEQWARKDTDMAIVIPPENYPYLKVGIDKSYDIERAWGRHSAGAFSQVVVEVRSRLLELALQVQDKIPHEPEAESIMDVSKEAAVSQVFRNTVYGSNNTIVVGAGSIQNVTNSILQNDLDSLVKAMAASGVKLEDLAEMRAAIQEDASTKEVKTKKGFGPAIRRWIVKMVGKAAEGGWDVGVSAAGGIIASAVAAYYGFGA